MTLVIGVLEDEEESIPCPRLLLNNTILFNGELTKILGRLLHILVQK